METRDRAPIVTVDRRAEWSAKGGPAIRDNLPPARLTHARQVAMLRITRRRLDEQAAGITDQLREMGEE